VGHLLRLCESGAGPEVCTPRAPRIVLENRQRDRERLRSDFRPNRVGADSQRSPAPGRQYRAMPSRNGRRQTTMQEISVMQQPTPADPELVAPGMLEGEPSEGEVIQ